jgi:hypothetical protein
MATVGSSNFDERAKTGWYSKSKPPNGALFALDREQFISGRMAHDHRTTSQDLVLAFRHLPPRVIKLSSVVVVDFL